MSESLDPRKQAVFISRTRGSRAVAERLVAPLREADFDVFDYQDRPTGAPAGMNARDVLIGKLRSTDVFVALLGDEFGGEAQSAGALFARKILDLEGKERPRSICEWEYEEMLKANVRREMHRRTWVCTLVGPLEQPEGTALQASTNVACTCGFGIAGTCFRKDRRQCAFVARLRDMNGESGTWVKEYQKPDDALFETERSIRQWLSEFNELLELQIRSLDWTIATLVAGIVGTTLLGVCVYFIRGPVPAACAVCASSLFSLGLSFLSYHRRRF